MAVSRVKKSSLNSPEFDFEDVSFNLSMNRREFLKLFGGGVFVFFAGGTCSSAVSQIAQSYARDNLNSFLRIGEDGRVTCFTGKVEIGQGVVTSLAQLMADELDVSLETVDMVMGDTALCPWDQGTFDSRSIRLFGIRLRRAAAKARLILIRMAAERLDVPAVYLGVEDGIVVDSRNAARRVSYAELTGGQTILDRIHDQPPLKDASEHDIIGRPILRRDALDKITGRAKYAGDIRLPGMLYAKTLRPPSHGARLKRIDDSKLTGVDGARLVRHEDFAAVVHPSPDVAEKALKLIDAEYEETEVDIDHETVFERLLAAEPDGGVLSSDGYLEAGRNLSDTVFERRYLNSYVAHAPIETHTATAQIKDGAVTVWVSTQTPFSAQRYLARKLILPEANVRVKTPFVGGAFGGKIRNDQAFQAAFCAKVTGRPVQVSWTRQDEFFFDTFRPASIVDISSGMTESGKIMFWDYTVYFAGTRSATHFYDIPHYRVKAHGLKEHLTRGFHPFNTGPWRGVGGSTNTFARESHIDVMAAGAPMDPVEFRMKNLAGDRMKRALAAAAKRFGWTPMPSPSGRGFGVACGFDTGSYVVQMAEVEVDEKSGRVDVKRVVTAMDMGLVVNPEGARLQIEGAAMMGLGYALTEEIHFEGGKIHDLNFDTYEIPKFSWLPKTEVVLIDADDEPSQGCGEPPVICAGAALANAIFDKTGVRMLQLPMTPDRIKSEIRRRG